MNKENLKIIAEKLCADSKGILAADESTNTIKKRFDSINVDSNFETRRTYREILFKTPDLNKYISGVILFDETLRQKGSDDVLLSEYLISKNIIPGIKVDIGAIELEKNSEEKLTEGLDGLGKRLEEYRKFGAAFTKWRAIINIDTKKKQPSEYCIEANSYNLGRYAKIVQDYGMVPIVEPEVIMDGEHSIKDCFDVTSKTLKSVFKHLNIHKVYIEGILLKPNMVISGTKNEKQASVGEVASMTIKCLKDNVPDNLPGIVFLSGGQSNELATQHLNEMNKENTDLPWKLSFSYGRALQQPALSKWLGEDRNIESSQKALFHRSKLNSDATSGIYKPEDEKLIL